MATSIGRMQEKEPALFDQLGRTVVHEGELPRHSVYTRFLHWAYGIFFFLALFTGFAIYMPFLFRWFAPAFGGPATTRMLHPYFGVGFVFFFGLQIINWWGPMSWTEADSRWIKHLPEFLRNAEPVEPEDVGMYNGGQKLQFWEIVVGCIVYLITGIIMWAGAPTFGAVAVAVSYVLHDISALIMLFGIFFHLYQSTFGQPGTIQAMTRGTVSEAWAWTHAPAWYRQMTGRDPRQALEQERQRRINRERAIEQLSRGGPTGPPGGGRA
ncbi:MAG: formate dehydrogenase subunit gamma [Terriglobales bacterium]